MRYVAMSHIGLTSAPDALACPAGTSMANPNPTPMSPAENLTGLDGSREPSPTHNQAKTGANVMMKSAFADWNQLLGKFHPRIEFRVARSAKRLSVDPACSNSDQNRAAARKKTPMA